MLLSRRLLLNLIESIPNLPDELVQPATEIRPFEDVQHATVMILVKKPSLLPKLSQLEETELEPK